MSQEKGILYAFSLPFEAIAWALCNAVGRRGTAFSMLSLFIIALAPVIWIVTGAKYGFRWILGIHVVIVVLLCVAREKLTKNPLGGLAVAFVWKLILATPLIAIFWFVTVVWVADRFGTEPETGALGVPAVITNAVFLVFWGGSAIASLLRHIQARQGNRGLTH